jgi:hypothetical protein
MKKIVILILFFYSFLYITKGDNYAFIMIASTPSNDIHVDWDENDNKWYIDHQNISSSGDMCYWNDTYLWYEYLVEKAGYKQDNIYVFYGNGDDWICDPTSEYCYIQDRYNPFVQQKGWEIVRYNNEDETLENTIDNLIDNQLNESDNILVIWLSHGHGGQDPDNSYHCSTLNIPDINGDKFSDVLLFNDSQFYFENNPDELAEVIDDLNNELYLLNEYYYDNINADTYEEHKIINLFSFEDEITHIKKFKKRKILFFTCHSGVLVHGNLKFDGDETVVITSADDSESSRHPQEPPHYWWSDFFIWGPLNNIDPYASLNYDGSFDSKSWTYAYEINSMDDHVLSIKELYADFKYNAGESLYVSGSFHPQLNDDCNRADYIYITEDLLLKNATLSLRTFENVQEDFRGYWVDKITAKDGLVIPSDSKVLFAVDKSFHLKPGFKSVDGAYFHAYFGEIECQY